MSLDSYSYLDRTATADCQDWLIPWVHYVPVQVDYSDLYNIMSFFSGPPSHNGSQMIRDGGNDELAKAIAEAGRQFGEEHWRWVDMQGYMFRLLLEYVFHRVYR